jgi:hypothetical protein
MNNTYRKPEEENEFFCQHPICWDFAKPKARKEKFDQPKKRVQTSTNEKILSCPGFTKSLTPPGLYFDGLALQLMTYKQAAEKSVDAANSAKPAQFSRPRTPATAPAKHEERNLVVLSTLLCATLGA